MKTKIIVLALLFGTFGFSCKPSDSPAPDTDFGCDKVAKITSQILGDMPITIEYDAKGRIHKVLRADGKGLIENYTYLNDTTLTITRNFREGGVGNTFSAILSSQGYIKKYTTVGTTPELAFTNTYTYNAEGRLTESAFKSNNPVQMYRTTYLYEGGNLKSTQSYLDGKLSYSESYQYTSDVNKADLNFNENRPGMRGRFSANLVESIETTYADGKKEKYAFTYELNTHGFVKSQIQTYTDQEGKTTTQINKYGYICQ
jgi:hypothetical protein